MDKYIKLTFELVVIAILYLATLHLLWNFLYHISI